ncbi:hypothetical protein Tmar_0902 [Thermaerobacter marianensis DSM 12885]|uniref:Uncharacterized protein n=1 Tax=Thermaerobacter marianensis (strain ATCC 700841 / DSM 12885 / JCM 10246 / 7p75a) TaxID=644966 RepID=E6SJ88_THEM7|nr:hypothetical protein [Thermaerobacter marianensis]ADU51016.1 hypothetical protein Tmar_0902 [Thermaerobacter marianensis DSM 12885]
MTRVGSRRGDPPSQRPARPARPPGPWASPDARRAVLAALVLLALLALARWPGGRTVPGPLGRFVPAGGIRAAELAFAWPEYRARVVLTSDERQHLARALAATRPVAGRGAASPPSPHFAYWQLDWTDAAGRRHALLISPDGRFFSPERGYLDRTGPLWAVVQPVTERLAAGFFGEPLPWPEVDRLWPWDAVAVLRDLETGRTLRAVRYGGYQHADAEPLTREDTAVLRSLYGGAWSWRRRAVVLEVAGRRVAASINGMPHGNGIVAENDFDGHFCVHTLEATTHVRDRSDPGHQLMVLKSSGRLVDHLRSAPPHAAAAWLWIALANGDVATASHVVADPRDPGWTVLARRLATVLQFVEVEQASTLAVRGSQARVRLRGTAYYTGDRPPARLDVTWTMTRHDGFWTVAAADVAGLLPPPAPAAPGPAPGDSRWTWPAGRRGPAAAAGPAHPGTVPPPARVGCAGDPGGGP